MMDTREAQLEAALRAVLAEYRQCYITRPFWVSVEAGEKLFRQMSAVVIALELLATQADERAVLPSDDAELLDWLRVAAGQTPRPAAGDFVRTIAEAGLRADRDNYELLRPALLKLKAKYPQHSRSAEEIRKDLEG